MAEIDPYDQRRFPPRKVEGDVLKAKRCLIGAQVRAVWITEVDGWLGLELGAVASPLVDCQVLVNPTDIRFFREQ